MKNTYKTAEVAKLIGIHSNTVRLYEELELISKPQRLDNGYRVFTDLHLEQFKLVRTALKVEVLQNGLRRKMIAIIKLSAKGEYEKAISHTKSYIKQIEIEQKNAEEAIKITEQFLIHTHLENDESTFTRKEVADYLQITMDTLRNWEMNGLLQVKRKENGYRIYTEQDVRLLKIIRSLRCANYSLSSILRMINAINYNNVINVREVIDTPDSDEDIVSVCDTLCTSLEHAKKNAIAILEHINYIAKKYNNPPL